jgi:hypothetical protein
MKKVSEEAQVIKSAIKFYHAAVKEYAVLGNINDVLQSMIDDLVAYTVDPMPDDWQSLAGKLYSDLSILEKAAQDNGIVNANILSPLSSASQIARNLTKLNSTEPPQKLFHYYIAIRNNLCDALKNVSPDPRVTTSKSIKAFVNYNKLIRFETDSVQSIVNKLQNVVDEHENITLEDLNDLHDLLDSIYGAFEAYIAQDGRTYFDINPKFNTAMQNGLHALANPRAYQLSDALHIIKNIINVYDTRPIK